MATRREMRRWRLDREAVEEDGRLRLGATEKTPLKSDDEDEEDREANEDLSLKIVEKALLLRAANLVSDGDGVVSVETHGAEEDASEENGVDKRGKKVITRIVKKVVKKKKVIKKEIADSGAFVIEEKENKPEAVEVAAEAESVVTEVEPKTIEATENNIVLRKLLRGPRYFDPPDNSWGVCYNCGEEGHNAVNCTSAKRKKPCFVCGSFEHNVRQCTQGRNCFICKKGGHRAKDCPDKYKSSSISSNICLKCGDSGHDLFFCMNSYNSDDLKEICCYVCKKVGHLCCVNYADSCVKEISCYRCGESGHNGLSCSGPNVETTFNESPGLCFKCKGCHLVRECTSNLKSRGKRKRMREAAAKEAAKAAKAAKKSKLHKSAPHDIGKPHKNNKTQQHKVSGVTRPKPSRQREVSGVTTPRPSKQRGGWMMEHPGDYSVERSKREGSGVTTPKPSKQRGGWMTEHPGDYSVERSKWNDWRSPATPSNVGHRNPYATHNHSHGHNHSRHGYNHGYDHVATPHYPNHADHGYRTPDFHGSFNDNYFQNGYSYGHSASRFGSSSGPNGSHGSWNRRNYDRW